MRRTFSPEYREILESALQRGEHLIPATPREARNLRSYFYHYRRYLRETGDILAEKADTLKFNITPEGLVILKPTAPGTDILRLSLS